MLNVIVCAKVMFDPEALVSTFRMDPRGKMRHASSGVPPIINPYDEHCIEVTLSIRNFSRARWP